MSKDFSLTNGTSAVILSYVRKVLERNNEFIIPTYSHPSLSFILPFILEQERKSQNCVMCFHETEGYIHSDRTPMENGDQKLLAKGVILSER